MATVRFAAASLLDTVVVTAGAVSKTVNSAALGADYVHNFMTSAVNAQVKRQKIDAVTLDYRLAEQAGVERAKERKLISAQCDADPVFKSHFEDAYSEYLEVLRPNQSQRTFKVAAE